MGTVVQEPENCIDLIVSRWSAWSPGLGDRSSWQAWAHGQGRKSEPANPDVRFVEPLLRRRLSPLSRMVFRVAEDCLDGLEREEPPLSVFCSRFGEFSRAFEMLSELATEQAPSPLAFSLSVHNTASSLFSIMRQDRAHSTALAAGEATLEAGFLAAWCLLREGEADEVLLLYGDRPLPDLYAPPETSISEPLALGFLLRLSQLGEAAQRLALTWRPNGSAIVAPVSPAGSSLGVLGLLLKGGEPIVLDSGRLTWTWSCDAPAA